VENNPKKPRFDAKRLNERLRAMFLITPDGFHQAAGRLYLFVRALTVELPKPSPSFYLSLPQAVLKQILKNNRLDYC
jgi:hypothetical protein